MARRLLQTPAARRRRARYRRNKKKTGGGGKFADILARPKKYGGAHRPKKYGGAARAQGLSKAVIASAKAAAKAGRTTLPPTAVKAINAKIRAAKKRGSGLGDSIRTSQTAFRGNPIAQKLNSAGLGRAARQLHVGMAMK